MRKWLKGLGIGLAAVVFSTLGISASDTLRGASGSLLSTVIQSETKGCSADSVAFMVGDITLCVDRFEAAPGDECPISNPKNLQESERNLTSAGCSAVSEEGKMPWRFINLSQAQRACASAGKRLLTAEEWYRAALGTEPGMMQCLLTGSQEPRTASVSTCKSTAGAYDMVGNVWEWVDAQVENGTYSERAMPDTGYVTGVDTHGVALSTHTTAGDILYGEDYYSHDKNGVRGMIRGGFYGSESDGGLYALNASVDLGFGSTGVGFRCVRVHPQN